MAHASSIRKAKPALQPKATKSIVISAKKINSVEKKVKKVVSAPQVKQAKAKPADLKVKEKSQKSEKAIPIKKSDAAAVKKKSAASSSTAKTKSKVLKTKNSAVKKISIKPTPKNSVRKSKLVKTQKIEAQKKIASVKPNVSVKKKVSAKSLSTVSAKQINSKIERNVSKAEQKVAAKPVKTPIISATKKIKSVKPSTIAKAKKNIKSPPITASKKTKSVKIQVQLPNKKLKVETAKFKETNAAKIVKNKIAKVAGNKKQKTKLVEEFGINTRKYSLLRKEKPQPQTENSKVAGKEINQSANNASAQNKTLADKNLRLVKAIDDKKNELKNSPSEPELIASKPKRKKAKIIGAAVFRGKKERYDFEVFPIDAEFEDVPAIYIISKRKIDKRKRAHHALVCIGQTNSLVAELKKHRKGKCVKKFAANSISLLREENEKQRLKIETDLKAAHAIPCVHT